MIAIIHLERGIPSKRASSKHIDYVPALCTHRPSLLPIEWVSELHELMFELVLQHGLWEVNQTCPFRGSKSRNKVNSYWSLAQLVPGPASWARRDKLKVEPQRYCQTAGNVKLGRSASRSSFAKSQAQLHWSAAKSVLFQYWSSSQTKWQ